VANANIDVGFGLGSNIGDKAGNIRHAFAELAGSNLFLSLELSSLYRTAPWGYVDQDWFINACAAGRTSAPPEQVLALCLAIEARIGRRREIRWGPRTIDVDILYYGELASDRADLRLPHPEMLNRAFVLVPLLEIRPALSIAGKPLIRALERLDTSQVIRL
jgi:2-amino-4-hydroxy-6-hydroxymethyldihydropteridine diphosphokinase